MNLHELHLTRHVGQLKKLYPGERIDELLTRSDLALDDGNVQHRNGSNISDAQCLKYLEGVKNIFGDGVYSFARANFALAGCPCVRT